jgi:hypothetical protein
MAVAQHGTNITGHRQQHKGQEGRDFNTSRKASTFNILPQRAQFNKNMFSSQDAK